MSATPSLAPSKNQQHLRWSLMFQELSKYKEEHGDCRVPQFYDEFPQLGAWVCKQRAQYKMMKDGKPSSMTQDRVAALESINFDWALREKTDWESRMDELRQYKSLQGNCLIPGNFPSNPGLGRWAQEQRNQYKLFREGKPSKLTEEKIQNLEKLGFSWSSRCLLDSLWEKRLKELKAFKDVHGHVLVPQRYAANKQLGRFVKTQREQYKLLHQGKPSHLNAERVQDLDNLGFAWSV